MAGKITATFGADVSEVEAGMMRATRATKAYERAVKGVDGAKIGGNLTNDLAKSNEQIAKGINLLKGGAVGAGVGVLLGQMKSFAGYAKEMGDSATDAQKSAAKWGDELEKFTGTIKGAGASVLGTLAGWGRSIGDSFRDPMDKAYDDVAESSEMAAQRQEAALEKTKAAVKKAAEEIPALLEKLKGEKRETELSSLGEYGRILTERYELEKKIAELAKQKPSPLRDSEGLKLQIQLEQLARKEKQVTDKIKAEEAKAEEARINHEAAKRLEIAQQYEKDSLEQEAQIQKNAEARLDSIAKEKAAIKDLKAEIAKPDEADPRRNKDGRFTTKDGKSIVSDEDRARSDATRARNAGFDNESRRNRISDAGRVGSDNAKNPVETSNAYLKEIASALKPAEVKK